MRKCTCGREPELEEISVYDEECVTGYYYDCVCGIHSPWCYTPVEAAEEWEKLIENSNLRKG